MRFTESVISRYSCRSYKDKEILKEDLDLILECARLAPSAANRQPWKIYIIKNENIKKKICESYSGEWLKTAPLIAVFCGLKNNNWKRLDGADYLLCDITIVADHFIYAAHELGIGTCWVAAFNEQKVVETLNLSENEQPLILVPLGYPDDKAPAEKKRKTIEEICEFL